MENKDKTKEQLIEELGELRQKIVELEKEKIERKKTEDEILDIAKGVSSKIGESFFLELTEHIAKTLQADYAYIAEILPDDLNHVRTLALIADGKFIDNIEVNLDGTPCETVIKKGICSYSADVQKLFPHAHMMAKMNVESYFGIPLNSSSGECIGLMSVMYCKPITDVKMIEPFLKIFASRASSEIERKKAEEALQEKTREAQLFTDMLNRSSQPFVVGTPDGRLTRMNPAFCELTGYSEEELLRDVTGMIPLRHQNGENMKEKYYRNCLQQASLNVLKKSTFVKMANEYLLNC